MAPVALTYALRALLAIEFAAALGAWALGVCAWPVAGAVATGLLVTFMLTFPDASAPAPPSSRAA